MSHRVLLIEDSPVLRAALAELLVASGSFEQIGQAENLSEALDAYPSLRPSAVLVGPSRQFGRSIDIVIGLLRAAPQAKVLLFLLHDHEAAIAEAFRAGVAGVLGVQTTPKTLVAVLNKIADGGTYFEQPIDAILRYLDPRTSSRPHHLAPREQRILSLICEGKGSKEIANDLGLGVETVRYYRKSIMRKLKVHNVATLLRLAHAENLIPSATVRSS